jgi:hypothetical protein
MQYGEAPSNLPLRCDGCDAHFTLQHALGCKTGGLVIFRHRVGPPVGEPICDMDVWPSPVILD